MRRQTPLCLALLFIGTGCSVFDDSLYLVAEGESDGETEGMQDQLFSDVCFLGEVPIISASTSIALDLSEYSSVGLGYPKCVERQYQGPDAFFVLDAKAGQRWNINASPQAVDQDIAIIVLGDGCAPTGCKAVRDRCGAGFDEDFALIASEDTQYVVSIDSLDAGTAGKISLTTSLSVCGNGEVEPGESCDGGPNCDVQCRREVPAGEVFAEGEPNDIFTGVDMIGAPNEGGEVTITGSAGGPCDEDHYAFIVPDGASVSVRMYGPGGTPCPDDTPLIALPLIDFLSPGGPTPIGAGKTGGASGGCPYFDNLGTDPDFDFARNLPASEYHLIINAFETDKAIPYEIVFDIQKTTPA